MLFVPTLQGRAWPKAPAWMRNFSVDVESSERHGAVRWP
jgi:hypothetical protein